MKRETLVYSSIYGLGASRTFDRRVARLANKALRMYGLRKADQVELLRAGMQRGNGYGQYLFYLTIWIDGVALTFRKSSNDSIKWDWLHHDATELQTSNFLKALTLSMIEDNLDYIGSEIETRLMTVE